MTNWNIRYLTRGYIIWTRGKGYLTSWHRYLKMWQIEHVILQILAVIIRSGDHGYVHHGWSEWWGYIQYMPYLASWQHRRCSTLAEAAVRDSSERRLVVVREPKATCLVNLFLSVKVFFFGVLWCLGDAHWEFRGWPRVTLEQFQILTPFYPNILFLT
jgi:hypothetical protein